MNKFNKQIKVVPHFNFINFPLTAFFLIATWNVVCLSHSQCMGDTENV